MMSPSPRSTVFDLGVAAAWISVTVMVSVCGIKCRTKGLRKRKEEKEKKGTNFAALYYLRLGVL
jgi:hypothetical protein